MLPASVVVVCASLRACRESQECWVFHYSRNTGSLWDACCLQEGGFNILNVTSFQARLCHQHVAKDEWSRLQWVIQSGHGKWRVTDICTQDAQLASCAGLLPQGGHTHKYNGNDRKWHHHRHWLRWLMDKSILGKSVLIILIIFNSAKWDASVSFSVKIYLLVNDIKLANKW